jgi:hypothetical protein
MPGVGFARVRREPGVLKDCMAIGYPLFQFDSREQRFFTAELHGQIYQTDGHEVGRLLMRDPSVVPGGPAPAPALAGGPVEGGGSPWGGLSGAVVFHNDRAIGVVVQHHPDQGPSAVQLTSFDHLLTSGQPEAVAVAAALGLEDLDQLGWASADPVQPLADLVHPIGDFELPTVEELDPYRLGATVSVAADSSTYGQHDQYVPRTAHQADDRLATALSGHQMVMLVGPSKAGKTRTAFEALRRTIPTKRLAAPRPGMLTESPRV